MMNLNDFYILVNTDQKIVLDKIQKLPLNWKNIAGLPGLTNDELKNLEWAGQKNLGWICIKDKDLLKYKSSPENLILNKSEFKKLISDLRKEHQYGVIEYHGIKIRSDSQTLHSLFLLQNKDQVNYKCIDGYHTFNSSQIKDLYNLIELNIQKWFDWEMNIYSQIDSCQNISNFLDVNYEI